MSPYEPYHVEYSAGITQSGTIRVAWQVYRDKAFVAGGEVSHKQYSWALQESREAAADVIAASVFLSRADVLHRESGEECMSAFVVDAEIVDDEETP